MPKVVSDYINGIRLKEDSVAGFWVECVVAEEGSSVPAAAMQEAYLAYCKSRARSPVSPHALASRLKGLGADKARNSQRIRYLGIRLVNPEGPASEPYARESDPGPVSGVGVYAVQALPVDRNKSLADPEGVETPGTEQTSDYLKGAQPGSVYAVQALPVVLYNARARHEEPRSPHDASATSDEGTSTSGNSGTAFYTDNRQPLHCIHSDSGGDQAATAGGVDGPSDVIHPDNRNPLHTLHTDPPEPSQGTFVADAWEDIA